MAVHNCHSKSSAKKLASRFRDKGFDASIYKVKGKKGYRVSVTRGK